MTMVIDNSHAPAAIAAAAADDPPAAAPARKTAFNWSRLQAPVLAIVLPVLILIAWHVLTNGRPYSLIPPPVDVAKALYDLAFGGINDDAFSATLLTASQSEPR